MYIEDADGEPHGHGGTVGDTAPQAGADHAADVAAHGDVHSRHVAPVTGTAHDVENTVVEEDLDAAKVSADDGAAAAAPVSLRGGTALVATGGGVGTAARYLLDVTIPGGLLPLGTAIANITGAFALGLLVAVLSDYVGDPYRRHRLRLLLGTGVLGGYTTYSALSVDIATLTLDGAAAVAAGYGVGSLVLGGLACWLGLRTGRIGGGR